jgi:hypothetical protein
MFPSTNKSEFGHNLDLLKEPTPPKKKILIDSPIMDVPLGKKYSQIIFSKSRMIS